MLRKRKTQNKIRNSHIFIVFRRMFFWVCSQVWYPELGIMHNHSQFFGNAVSFSWSVHVLFIVIDVWCIHFRFAVLSPAPLDLLGHTVRCLALAVPVFHSEVCMSVTFDDCNTLAEEICLYIVMVVEMLKLLGWALNSFLLVAAALLASVGTAKFKTRLATRRIRPLDWLHCLRAYSHSEPVGWTLLNDPCFKIHLKEMDFFLISADCGFFNLCKN